MAVHYNDKLLRLVGYPVIGFIIRHFGEMGAIGQLLKTPLYYFDILFDTVIVAIVWESNRKLIRYLDKRYPWEVNGAQRLLLQGVVGLPMSFALVVPMVYLYNEVLTDHGNFDTANLLVMDLPLTIVFTVMVHMIYTGMYYRHYYTTRIRSLEERIAALQSSPGGSATGTQHREVLIVDYGSASVPVKTKDIAYIYKQNEVTFIRTADGKEYTASSSLDSLEAVIDPKSFFRINRQVLASRQSIRQFRSDSTGKVILDLHPPLNQETTISRKKAPEFRDWI